MTTCWVGINPHHNIRCGSYENEVLHLVPSQQNKRRRVVLYETIKKLKWKLKSRKQRMTRVMWVIRFEISLEYWDDFFNRDFALIARYLLYAHIPILLRGRKHEGFFIRNRISRLLLLSLMTWIHWNLSILTSTVIYW